jgi:exodeoxyribonuclease-5
MTAAWSDEARVEGRPDAQEAVALFTMHAAKGLEWPIVIPVNTMTGRHGARKRRHRPPDRDLYCPVLGVTPEGYEAARQAEKKSWTANASGSGIAATRARELLVLPGSTPRRRNRPGSVSRRSVARRPPGLDLSCLPASRPQQRA